jgi:ABC-type antimicrobial peptide transport system permease subunit
MEINVRGDADVSAVLSIGGERASHGADGWDDLPVTGVGLGGWLALWPRCRQSVGFFIVYLATLLDPPVLGGVLLTMLCLGLLAGWIPARRALGTDPLIPLHGE